MRQKGASKEALSFIKKEGEALVNKQGLTITKAFNMKKGAIQGLTLSGRTLRKVFEGIHIHTNSIEQLITELGGKFIIIKGKISIKNEEEAAEETDIHSEAVSSNE